MSDSCFDQLARRESFLWYHKPETPAAGAAQHRYGFDMADLESRWRESEIFLMLIGNHHLIRTLKAVPGTQTTAVFIYADRADRQLWAGGPTDEQRSRREHEVLRQYLAEPRLYDQVVLNCFGKDAFLAHTRMVFEHFLAGAVSV